MEKVLPSIDDVKQKSADELYQLFHSSKDGLSSEDARARLEIYGANEIKEKKVNPLLKFLSYFWGPIPWMIEIAAILSAIIHHWEDFAIISVLLLMNAVIGFWQEHKADNAIEMLKNRLALKAKALRNGHWVEVSACDLAPGDIVRVRLGEIVPADLKLIEGTTLQTDESALTGESLPVDKEAGDIAYSGSVIKKGEMNALVVATAMNTFFGKTAALVAEAKSESHFQKAVVKIGDYLIVLAVALVAIIFMVALFRHESWIVTLQFALVLTVAAIPVALPAVMSVTLAVGATALAKKKAIVSKLTAIEEMAGMDILCSDKTGTITQNKLTLADVTTYGKLSSDEVINYAALASREEDKDPIDDAIITKAKRIEKRVHYKEISFHPFDPVSKRTEATLENDSGKQIKVSKGAPQVILDLTADKDTLGGKVNAAVNDFASRGYRTLGVAVTDAKGTWHFVGLIPMYDPPRDDSAQTIMTANSMGVEVKMVTGDHIAIAKEIARQVKLKPNILLASAFASLTDSEASKLIEESDGFAQVFPEHKYKIIERLQQRGHFVGMTGDGVNDAPALKKADAGIAVEGATDAAKSAADIVLTSPGLSVIIDAIKEARKIFQRMNSYAIYRIAETIRVLFFVTLCILIFNVYPVTAVMIVLLALFNDAPIMAIANDNVHYSNEPEKWHMHEVIGMATVLGLFGVGVTFGAFYIADRVLGLSHEVVQSFIFLKLAVAGHYTIFITRTRGPFWSIRPSAGLFWSAVGTKVLATLVAVYGFYIAPIGWELAGMLWAYVTLEFIVTDFIKVRLYRLLDHRGIVFKKNELRIATETAH